MNNEDLIRRCEPLGDYNPVPCAPGAYRNGDTFCFAGDDRLAVIEPSDTADSVWHMHFYQGAAAVNQYLGDHPEAPGQLISGENVEQSKPVEINGSTSDGYHTFDELYRYRMLYNAAFLNKLYEHDRLLNRMDPLFFTTSQPCCGKSWKHSDGKPCFDGDWFIVWFWSNGHCISNHYEAKWWDLFRIPEQDTAPKWDGSTPAKQADWLTAYAMQRQATSDTITADEVDRMIQRVDDRLFPLCRYDGFRSGETIHRVGENGYVTDHEWNAAFLPEKWWAENAYLLEGNGWTSQQVADEYAQHHNLQRAVNRMFNNEDDTWADNVFATEATEEGEA